MIRYIKLIFLISIIFIPPLFSQSNLKPQSFIVKTSKPSAIQYLHFRFNYQIIYSQRIFQKYDKLEEASILSSKLDFEQLKMLKNLENYYRIDFAQTSAINEIIEYIKTFPDIVDIFPNYKYKLNRLKLPNDSLINEQWGLIATNTIQAWEKATGKDVIIGVVDTGIDFYHPDLIGNLWINSGEDLNKNGRFEPWHYLEIRNGISGDLNGIDDDGNGFIDDVIGFDFVNQNIRNIGDASTLDPIPYDEHGHGTAISGVIAATRNNYIGISGAVPDAKIMTIRVMDATGNGETDDIASGIVYAALNGAKVLNFSFGESYDSPLLHDAIKFAYSMGCVMFASSGNNGSDRRHYPSDYEEVVSVGSIDSRLIRDFRSNYGTRLDCVAPGVSIITTQVGNRYKSYSGTSLAAPFAASIAAMLIELDKTLTASEIKTIILSTAFDLDRPGWDIFTGAGLIDALSAVNNIGKSEITIIHPQNQQLFNKDKISSIDFTGSIITPLFDNFSILLGKGDNPSKWDTLSLNNFNQIKDNIIYNLETKNLADTTYTLKIIVNLKNKKTLEKNVQFEIYSSQSLLDFTDFSISSPYFNNRRVLSISAKTKLPARLSVQLHPVNKPENTIISTKSERYSIFQSLIIDKQIEFGVEYKGKAIAHYSQGDSITKEFDFYLPEDFFPENKFAFKKFLLPSAYLINNVADLYNDGKASVVINDFTDLTWGNVITFQFVDGQFIPRDTLRKIYIPAGLGDSNGDGLTEIMLYQSGKTFLSQAHKSGDTPFENIIFQDTLGFNFWGAGFFDFDKDGIPEIVAYSDTSFMLFTFENNQYKLLAQTKNEPNKKYIGTFPGYAFGDFDGDGNYELAHSNMQGDLFVFKFIDGSFKRIFVDTSGKSDWNQFLASADIDGDGTKEILQLNYGTNYFFPRNDGGNTFWQLKIYKFIGNDFKVIYTDYFYGVRAGVGYRNGILAGDLLKNNRDEVVLTLFPNLYIFEWDTYSNKLNPIFFYPSAYSNSGIIYDFDKNSINELGFCDGYKTLFIEYFKSDAPETPIDFDGWAINKSTAYITWRYVASAEKYLIYSIDENNIAELIAETLENHFLIKNLQPYKYHYYAIRSYNSNLDPKFSSWSKLIELYTNDPIKPVSVTAIDNKTFLLKFSGRLVHRIYETTLFSIFDNEMNYLGNPNTVQFSSDSILLLSFNYPINNGKYSLKCNSFRDYYKIPSIDTIIKFSIDLSEKSQELYLKNITVNSSEKLTLTYSEDAIVEQATNISNYLLMPQGKIAYIESTEKADKYIIYLDPSIPIGALGLNYTITVFNVASKTGNPMTKGAGNTLGFVFTNDDINETFAYPNPFLFTRDEYLTFAMLPERCEIDILTLNGELIQTLYENDGNGGFSWDVTDKNGKRLKSGVYLYRIIRLTPDGSKIESELKKFVVIN